MTETIKCCPFCGSHEVEVCRTNPNACWIRCGDCGADAESHPTRGGAIANWNRRHDDKTPVVIVDDGDRFGDGMTLNVELRGWTPQAASPSEQSERLERFVGHHWRG